MADAGDVVGRCGAVLRDLAESGSDLGCDGLPVGIADLAWCEHPRGVDRGAAEVVAEEADVVLGEGYVRQIRVDPPSVRPEGGGSVRFAAHFRLSGPTT
jgi:hypothetical protein